MAKIEHVLGEYMESLAGLVETLTDETRTRLSLFEEQGNRISENVDRLAAALQQQDQRLARLEESLKAIQQLMEAELSRLADGIEGQREAVLGAMLETRDRLREAELGLVDTYLQTQKTTEA